SERSACCRKTFERHEPGVARPPYRRSDAEQSARSRLLGFDRHGYVFRYSGGVHQICSEAAAARFRPGSVDRKGILEAIRGGDGADAAADVSDVNDGRFFGKISFSAYQRRFALRRYDAFDMGTGILYTVFWA